MSDAATMPPSGDLPRPEVSAGRPQHQSSNSPKRVINRGTSPMKGVSSSQPPHGGKHHDSQGSAYRNRGHRTYPKPDHTGDDQRRPARPQHGGGQTTQEYDQGLSQRKPREKRPRNARSSFNDRSPQKNGPKTGAVNGAVNGEAEHGRGQKSATDDAPNKGKSGASNGPAIQPLKQNDLRLNKLHDGPPAKPEDGGKKPVEKDALENAEPKALPQRKPRNRGAKHAQENEKSQVIVNGDVNHQVNGHS